MYQMVQKLKGIKREMKEWSKIVSENVHEKLTRNAYKIDFVESKLLSNLNSYRFNSWMNCLLKQR